MQVLGEAEAEAEAAASGSTVAISASSSDISQSSPTLDVGWVLLLLRNPDGPCRCTSARSPHVDHHADGPCLLPSKAFEPITLARESERPVHVYAGLWVIWWPVPNLTTTLNL